MTDAALDSGPDGMPDAMTDAMSDAIPDAAADAAPDAFPPDAYNGQHVIGELGPGLVTLAGFGSAGHIDGAREVSLFRNPVNVLVGPSGDLYVADFDNDAIRVVTPEGVTSTLVQQVGFARPFGMVFTQSGDFYVQTDRSSVDNNTGALWQVALDTGVASLVIDDAGRVRGLGALSDGRLVMADAEDHTISIYNPVSTTRITIAGVSGMPGFANGTGSDARFDRPLDVEVTSTDTIYVADSGNHRVRHVTLEGVVATVSGNGTAASVDGNALSGSFDTPVGLALQDDSTLYISEFGSGLVRLLAGGVITTVAGSTPGFADSPDPLLGQLHVTEGIDLAGSYLYISDGNGGTSDFFHRVRRLQIGN